VGLVIIYFDMHETNILGMAMRHNVVGVLPVFCKTYVWERERERALERNLPWPGPWWCNNATEFLHKIQLKN